MQSVSLEMGGTYTFGLMVGVLILPSRYAFLHYSALPHCEIVVSMNTGYTGILIPDHGIYYLEGY